MIRLQGDPDNPGDLAATALKNRLIETLLVSPRGGRRRLRAERHRSRALAGRREGGGADGRGAHDARGDGRRQGGSRAR